MDEGDIAKNTAEWCSFGFLFTLSVLSFSKARPRNASVMEYEEKDDLRLTDFSNACASCVAAAVQCRPNSRPWYQNPYSGALKWHRDIGDGP